MAATAGGSDAWKNEPPSSVPTSSGNGTVAFVCGEPT